MAMLKTTLTAMTTMRTSSVLKIAMRTKIMMAMEIQPAGRLTVMCHKAMCLMLMTVMTMILISLQVNFIIEIVILTVWAIQTTKSYYVKKRRDT